MMTKLAGFLLLLFTIACGERATPRSAGPAIAPKEALDLLNKPAPAFSVERIDRPGTLSVPSGRVTLVIFTGAWSQGSQRALRAIADVHRRFGELDIAAISMDEKADDGRSFAQSWVETVPIGHDPWGKKVAGAWAQNPYLPNTVFLLDRKGTVRYVGRGGKDGWYPEVAKEIPVEVEKLLAGG